MKINERCAVWGRILALFLDYFNILQHPATSGNLSYVTFTGN